MAGAGAPEDLIHIAMLLLSSPGINNYAIKDLRLALILFLLAFEYVYLLLPQALAVVYLLTKVSRALTTATPGWTTYGSALTIGYVPHVLIIVGPAPILQYRGPRVFHQDKEHRSTPL